MFVDFEGVMTASTVWINGTKLGEYKGGYTPFSFDLTPHIDFNGENVLAVDVDSSERPDIPPFGYEIDYLTFGGIYREVWLRIVPSTFIENMVVRTKDALPNLGSRSRLLHPASGSVSRRNASRSRIRDGDRVIANASQSWPRRLLPAEPGLPSSPLRWAQWNRTLGYRKTKSVYGSRSSAPRDEVIDEDSRRFAFRQAQFTDHGFEFNGKVVKLRGLDRHQTFPWVGQAMPARPQRRDAIILRNQLKRNIVRTSHYPQSRHFLDACDEIGLLVLEEIPGWQHIGDAAWKDISVDYVGRMIRRDWNHPSIILWGVRINESRDNHDFYKRTNARPINSIPPARPEALAISRSQNFLKTFSP